MSPVHLHLLVNHVPIIAIPLLAFLLLVALWRDDSPLWRLSMVVFLFVSVLSYVALRSGHGAEDVARILPGVTREAIHDHEEAAELAWWLTLGSGVAALAAVLWWRTRPVPRAVTAVALVVMLGLSVDYAWVAYEGGQVRHIEIRPGVDDSLQAVADSARAARRAERERRQQQGDTAPPPAAR